MLCAKPGGPFPGGKEPLGAGGNGQVWRAESADGKIGGIKILSSGGGLGGRYRLGRFLDEIAFLRSHPATPGSCPFWTAGSRTI